MPSYEGVALYHRASVLLLKLISALQERATTLYLSFASFISEKHCNTLTAEIPFRDPIANADMACATRFMWTCVLLFASTLGLSYRTDKFTVLAHARDAKETYDYVIIGGGTSGLTVADRLSEDRKTTVLVIEYGTLDDAPIIDELQAWFLIQITQPQLFYNITSVPQPSLRNRAFPILIGKTVGGSSAVNAMMAIRGSKQDYDQWGALFSKSSPWTWEGMLPYFKKAVRFTPPDPALAPVIPNDPALWGKTSGVHAAWPSFQYPATFAQVQTWKDMPGVNFRPDSGTGVPGLYWYPTFMSPTNGTRSYARTGHWENIPRPNYHLLTRSKVDKILLHGTTAYGVKFTSLTDGLTTGSIRANKEVILAAGAIHSPQIMQLSGLGPKSLLESANITVTVDLPGVGQNFQDHISLSANFTCKRKYSIQLLALPPSTSRSLTDLSQIST